MRNRAVWFLVTCILASITSSRITAIALQLDEKNILQIPVYLDQAHSGEAISFAVSAETQNLKTLSSAPMAAARPMLVIIDPTSYPTPELRRRITGLIGGLNPAMQKQAQPQIRLGIAVHDGILFDPSVLSGAVSGNAASDILQFIPDTAAGQESDPGRMLSLAAALLKKAETDGQSIDCILLGKDRPFEGEDAEYLRLSSERRWLELCARKGSVLHGYLEGDGALRTICAATGGMVFSSQEPSASVVRQILEARGRARVVAVQKETVQTRPGRYALTFRVEDSRGNPINSQAPAAVWWNPEDVSAPEYESVREALDWIGRAQKSAETGDFRVALRFVDNAIQLDPCNPDTGYYGARYSFELGDFPTAATFISKAAQFAHPNERALLLYGEVFRKLGKSAQALETIRTLPEGEVPKSSQFRLMMARLLSSQGREQEAANLYAEILGAAHDKAQIGAEYGCTLWRLGKEASAEKQLQSALDADPENVSAMICSMDMLAARGAIGKALDLGIRAAKLQPKNPDVHAQIGKVRTQAHEWDSALESYRTASELAPARSDILLKLAEAQVQAGQNRDGEETVGKVLALDPSNATTYEQIAALYSRAGSFENAASILEESTARVPDKASSFYRTAAELRERKEQYGQALLDYRALLESVPHDRTSQLQHELAPHLAYLSLMLKSSAQSGNAAGNAAGASAAAAGSPTAAQYGIVVRGGLPLLATMLGINPATLKEPGAAGRVFSSILESIPRSNDKKISQLQSELAEGYFQYANLLRYMEQQKLLPAGNSSLKRQEFVFPLVGDKTAIQRVQTLLSFFGVKYSITQKGGANKIDLTYKADRKSIARQRLLRQMGTDVQVKTLREIRFSLGDETLPTILDAKVLLDKLLNLPNVGPENLLGSLILHPDSMRLYLALEDCSPALREALVQELNAKELADVKSALADYGRFLEFHEGRLVLPGSQQSWENLVHAPYSDPKAFLRAFVTYDKGRLLLTYFAVQSAAPEVQRFLTNGAGGLEEISRLNPPVATGLTVANWQADLVRIMRIACADGKGLYLPIDDRFAPRLMPNAARAQASPRSSGYAPLRVTLSDLAGLVQLRARTDDAAVRTGAGIVEFLNYLQQARPQMLTDASINAIGFNLVNARAFMDVIWNLNPPADLLAQYLDFCNGLVEKQDSDWKINRTRTSQAILFLISALGREGVVDLPTGWKLLAAALENFRAKDEVEFLVKVSQYLFDQLLPELSRSSGLPAGSPDALLVSLAGHHPPQDFLFEGTPIVQAESAERLQQIKASIRPQRICSVVDILNAIRPLFDPQNRESGMKTFAENVGNLTCAEASASSSAKTDKRKSAPDFNQAASRLESLLNGPPPKPRHLDDPTIVVTVPQMMQQISSALDTELGVALLAHCYAYYGTTQIAALSYNADFIRSHDFFRPGRSSPAFWSAALLEAGADQRGLITGLLSGLGIRMHQLEMGPSAQSFGKEPWNRLAPAILSGMRTTSRSLRSDRTQEYVALSVRLGRELLALHATAPAAAGWLDLCANGLISPIRREQLKTFLATGSFKEALDLFSPSELFLLGEAYLLSSEILPASTCHRLTGFVRRAGNACGKESFGKAPEFSSPTLERLRKIVPSAASPELETFQKEVEQYGFLAWRRIGLADNSFRFYESYEQLQFPSTMDILFERFNDLKIRLAEISYSAGLPASVNELLGDMALQRLVTDPATANIQNWKGVIDQIEKLGPDQCRGWVEELLGTGALSAYSGKSIQHPEGF
jgi:tetratricopeptide (TPR) repeat protein